MLVHLLRWCGRRRGRFTHFAFTVNFTHCVKTKPDSGFTVKSRTLRWSVEITLCATSLFVASGVFVRTRSRTASRQLEASSGPCWL